MGTHSGLMSSRVEPVEGHGTDLGDHDMTCSQNHRSSSSSACSFPRFQHTRILGCAAHIDQSPTTSETSQSAFAEAEHPIRPLRVSPLASSTRVVESVGLINEANQNSCVCDHVECGVN
jgi:hypothetical protein